MDTTADVGTVRRWLAGLFALTFVFDVLAVLSAYGEVSIIGPLLSLPLVACALAAGERPVQMAVTGSVYVPAVSVLLAVLRVPAPYGPGITSFQVTEMAAGAALVGFAVWRCKAETATWCTMMLAVSGVGSLVLRLLGSYRMSNRELIYSGLAGSWSSSSRSPSGSTCGARPGTGPERRLYARRQWPLAGALGLLMCVDVAAGTSVIVSDSFLSLSFSLPVIAAAASGVAAYLGPKQPVRMALLAAGVTVTAAWMLLPAELILHDSPRLVLPVTTVGAHMALIAYVIRYAERRQAVTAVAGLVVADMLALVPSMRTDSLHAMMSDLRDYLLLGGLLLVVAAATGQYFRGRGP